MKTPENINYVHRRFMVDMTLLSAVVLLIAIGMMMVYSASVAYASSSHGNTVIGQYYYLIRHSISIFLGIILGIVAFFIPSDNWAKIAPKLAILIGVLLLIVLIPHIGSTVNGSKRWLGFGLINIQPSEFAKLSIAIYTAYYASNNNLSSKNFRKDILPIIFVVAFYCVLLLVEPDMGAATMVFLIALGVLFMANIDKKIIIGFIVFGIISFILLIILAPYRLKRLIGAFDPWKDAFGKGYQLSHSLLAFGHGGWFGVGLGNSVEKLFYLPEAHTDFILAIIGEEFGAFGVFVTLLLFLVIFYRGFNVIGVTASKFAELKFQSLLAQGISLWFVLQSIINVGVCIGIFPTKGLTLPLISYGGSSILSNCIALGILLRIGYELRIKLNGRGL